MLLNFLFLVLLFQICNSVDSITPKHSLAGDDLLVSEDGKFALGFFKPGNSNYTYLGIWYQKITIQTVIWVANRNNPIRGSSGKLLINPKGNLILYDHQDFKFPVWSTNVSAEKTNFSCEAQLLNTGNLVLVLSGSRVTLWQSFDYPTDTLLPGMKLGLDLHTGQDLFLTAWKSVDDPAIGNYLLRLNTVGSPQFFLYNGSIPQWRSHPWPWPTHSETGQAGYVYRITFAKNEEEIYYTYLVDDESLLIRTSVDPFGLLRRVTWDYSSHQWKATLSAPIYAYGHCGPYSLCDSSRSFECTCLPGYAPKLVKDWDLRDASSGCIRKREASLSMCRNREGFVKLSSVKLPDTSIASLLNTSMTVSGCEQLCLGNCKCKAYAAVDIQRKGDGCLTWYGELSDATAYTNGYDLYVRVDSIELAESSPRRSNRFLEKKGRLVIIVLAAGLSALLIILSVFWWLKKKRLTTVKRRLTRRICSVMTANGLVEGSQHPDLTFFNLETISTATNNFSPANKLGQGGFGTVYKGKLLDGQEIAVKRLSRSSVQGVEEFVNEIILIARLQHRNLVKLLGCCIQGEEQMLIYEYLQNKSLDSFIFDQAQKLLLDWRQRFEIIIAIARGIMYLHHDSRLRIIHRDLKTSNILLDNRMNPKISDFGLARIFGGDQDQDMTKRVAGTYGYMSPEYITFGKYSTKSDVFGFGVILLEIITGKKSCSRYEEELSLNLMEHVWDMWREHRVNELVDSSLLTNAYVPSEVLRCVQIGLLCVEEDSMDRPNMSEVVLMLNGDTALPFPKRPAFVSRSNHEINASAPRKDSCSANEVTVSSVKPR